MRNDGSRPQPVPRALQVAAGLSWRLFVVAAAIVAVALVVARLRLVFLPCLVALFLATLLSPPTRALIRRGWPRSLAALAAILGSLTVAAGVGWAVAVPAAGELDDLDLGVRSGIERVREWLVEGPLGLSERQVDRSIERGLDELRSNGGTIAGGLVSGTLLLAEAVAGALLTLVLLFFFLKDGERMWSWIAALFPPSTVLTSRRSAPGPGERWAPIWAVSPQSDLSTPS
jgi:putative heme transporter